MRKVFLDDLPKKGKLIDWKNSIGYIVKFIYDDIEGEFGIAEYKANNVILLKYKNYDLFETKTNRLKRCELKGLLKEELLRPKYDENNPKRVDLRKVPLNSYGIDWKRVAKNQMKIPFVYNNIKGEIKIIDYDGRKLRVEYENNKKIIDRGLFIEGKVGNVIMNSIIKNEDYYIQNKFGYVDLRKLPKNIIGVDWNNSVGYTINFKYKGIEDKFKIIKYYKKEQKIKILYSNKNQIINTSSIYNIGFSWITGEVTKEYRYNIGDTVDDVMLTKYIKVKNGNMVKRKGYKYRCLKCGYIGETSEAHIRDNSRGICPVCCIPNRKVVKGINDIATTHPHLIKYFVNKEDVYKYSHASNKKVLLKCPNCNNVKEMSISHLEYGFSCPKCSDGKSYGEKFVFNILSQLGINFEIEKVFKWSRNITFKNSKLNGNKRYDFYIPAINVIIETHGGQHYRYTGRGRPLELEQQNDILKKSIAFANGIKENNYIVINTSNTELLRIKNNILNSNLAKLFDLSKIDWSKCEEFALSNRVKEVCDYWNKGLHKTKKISEETKLSRNTIIRYLKTGNKINWCNYNPQQEVKNNSQRIGDINKKTIICLTTYEVFDSIKEAEEKYLIRNKISLCCNNKRESAGKHPITGERLKWMFYDDYLKIHNEI